MDFIHQRPPLYTAVRRDVTEHWKRALVVGWQYQPSTGAMAPIVFELDASVAKAMWPIGDGPQISGCYGSELEANVAVKELNGK